MGSSVLPRGLPRRLPRRPPEGHEEDSRENENTARRGPRRDPLVPEQASPQDRQERVEDRESADDGNGKPGDEPLGPEKRGGADDSEGAERGNRSRRPPRRRTALEDRRGHEQDGRGDERLSPDVGRGRDARQALLDEDGGGGGEETGQAGVEPLLRREHAGVGHADLKEPDECDRPRLPCRDGGPRRLEDEGGKQEAGERHPQAGKTKRRKSGQPDLDPEPVPAPERRKQPEDAEVAAAGGRHAAHASPRSKVQGPRSKVDE